MLGVFDQPLELPPCVFEDGEHYVVYEKHKRVGIATIVSNNVNDVQEEGFLRTIDVDIAFDDGRDTLECTCECEIDVRRNCMMFRYYDRPIYTCYADTKAFLGVYNTLLRRVAHTFQQGCQYLVYQDERQVGVATIVHNMINAPVDDGWLRTVHAHIEWNNDDKDPVECTCLCYIEGRNNYVSFEYWSDDTTRYVCHSNDELICLSDTMFSLLLQ